MYVCICARTCGEGELSAIEFHDDDDNERCTYIYIYICKRGRTGLRATLAPAADGNRTRPTDISRRIFNRPASKTGDRVDDDENDFVIRMLSCE